MDSITRNVLLVGVGGQGTILAGRVLSEGFLAAGFDVKMSEIHGMAQRGGSVSTHVRFGEQVYSPVICRGEADLLVAFEKLEAVRWLPWLAPAGKLLVNDWEIPPLPVMLGLMKYPEAVETALAPVVPELRVVQASRIAENMGNPRGMNMILLGAAVKILGLEDGPWPETLRSCLPADALPMNEKAFLKGMSLANGGSEGRTGTSA